MTRDDIIRMAQEAKLPMAWITESGVISWPQLERFAAIVAAAEREACARVCDEILRDLYIVDGDASDEVARCAAHIRERGKQK